MQVDEFQEISRLLTEACDTTCTTAGAQEAPSSRAFRVTSGDVPVSSQHQRQAPFSMLNWSRSGAVPGASDGGNVRSSQRPFGHSSLNASATPFCADFAGASTAGHPLFSNAHASAPLLSTWPSTSTNASFRPAAPQGYSAPTATVTTASIPDEWLVPYASHHLVGVLNLEPRTTRKQLFDIFFPMGAVDAALVPPSIMAAGSRRLAGIVMFLSADMAKIAAEKLHDFVPHGQSFPLTVSYISRASSSSTSGNASTVASSASPAASIAVPTTGPSTCVSSTPRPTDAATGTPTPQSLSSLTNAALLDVFKTCIERPMASSSEMSSMWIAMLTNPTRSKTLIEDSVNAVHHRILSMGFHSPIFTPPFAGALQRIVDRMEKELSGSTLQSLNAALSTTAPLATIADLYSHFKRCLSQSMLQLLLNKQAEKGCRCVAGVVIGYLFEFQYLAGEPFAMAKKLMEVNDEAMQACRHFLWLESERTRLGETAAADASEEAVHNPWLHLVEALVSMTSSWSQRHPNREVTPTESAFHALVRRFYSSQSNADSTDGDSGSATILKTPGSSSGKSSHGDDGASSSAMPASRLTPPATPSSRPTPSSAVVARVSPCKPTAPVTPRSECGATPLDTSVESNMSSASATAGSSSFSLSVPGLWMPTQRIGSRGSGSSSQQATPNLGGAASAGGDGASPVSSLIQKDLLACTVYLTKLPGGISDAKLRRLIAYFGEFHKVRMYKEKTPPAIRGGGASMASFGSNASRGSFGFVEYAVAASAKSMIDYFRNAPMTCAHPFHFLVDGDPATRFHDDEIRQLSLTRASYAKSAIHDHHPRDAVVEPVSPAGTTPPPDSQQHHQQRLRIQPCTFGVPSADAPHNRVVQHSDPREAAGLSLGLFDTSGTW